MVMSHSIRTLSEILKKLESKRLFITQIVFSLCQANDEALCWISVCVGDVSEDAGNASAGVFQVLSPSFPERHSDPDHSHRARGNLGNHLQSSKVTLLLHKQFINPHLQI